MEVDWRRVIWRELLRADCWLDRGGLRFFTITDRKGIGGRGPARQPQNDFSAVMLRRSEPHSSTKPQGSAAIAYLPMSLLRDRPRSEKRNALAVPGSCTTAHAQRVLRSAHKRCRR